MARRILLVDDDIAEISAVKRVLHRARYQVVLATNASDALSLVEDWLPELLLVATGCESGEGAGLARRLAADERTRAVPMVLLGDAVIGGVPALPPPIDATALDAAIQKAFEEGAGQAPTSWLDERRAAADALRARAEELRRARADRATAARVAGGAAAEGVPGEATAAAAPGAPRPARRAPTLPRRRLVRRRAGAPACGAGAAPGARLHARPLAPAAGGGREGPGRRGRRGGAGRARAG